MTNNGIKQVLERTKRKHWKQFQKETFAAIWVLAEEAKKIVSTFSDVISVNILDAEQCKELKMGAYLSVAAATTENPPYFIHLCFKTLTNEHKRKIALVGKGLTFDSGGYNLKTGAGSKIELMKYDMGGAAVVLGATKALGEIRPFGVEVHFIVAACENMISGAGMRPGDIVTASNEIHFINLLIMELVFNSSRERKIGEVTYYLEDPNCVDQQFEKLEFVELREFEGTIFELILLKQILAYPFTFKDDC
ncbi:leucine aminopeptidase, chloroplastic-like [Solanum tuberosum]|uniref:leucine aminopeptidase, chloroplastic-like n=1 Tax=Solanum tuberosum TaxID=4113 RepID=UPI00073A2231|nr:PREDICTED: leucine aminopeptidase, chloroplastic-like [Solanum tuberosum]